MDFGSVYVIKNVLNNKYYVGQTRLPIYTRVQAHTKYGYLLTKAINKYSVDNFILERLIVTPINQLDEVEKEYIKYYDSIQPNGYNILEFGNRSESPYWTGETRSEETKLKVSLSKKGTCSGKDNHFYGKRHSEETLEKIRQKAKGRTLSLETRGKLSRIRKGHPVSEETRRKLSLANRGRPPAKHTLEAATLARRLKASQKYI